MASKRKQNKVQLLFIIGASILFPTLVAILYLSPRLKLEGVNLSFLPQMNAILNGITIMMLLMGLFAIKEKIIFLHRRFMTAAMVFSVLFLLSSILHHATSDSTTYGSDGLLKYIYYFILISHIILAAAIVPLFLITYVRALSKRFDKHRKIARITLPVWLYVSITGIIAYLMISSY